MGLSELIHSGGFTKRQARQIIDTSGAVSPAHIAAFAPIGKDCRTILLGDSTDASVQGWFAYYSLNSKKIKTIRNAGLAGDMTSGMLARIQTDVLAYSPDIVVLGSTTNDQAQGIAESVTRANIAAMVIACRSTGATVILRTTLPCDLAGAGVFATVAQRRQGILRQNAWLRAFATKNGLDVLDVYQAVADPLTGGYQAGISDGLHPNETGYKAIADYLLTQPIPPAFKGGFSFARSVTDEANLAVNGVFLGDANSDGLADSWLLSQGTPTKTLTTGGAGITGNWQRITAVDATTVVIVQDITTGYAIGDTVEIVGRVRTSGTATALVRAAFWSGTSSMADLVANTTKPLDGIFSGRGVVTTGTTKIRIQFQTSLAAGWIEVAEIGLRNLTTLGLA